MGFHDEVVDAVPATSHVSAAPTVPVASQNPRSYPGTCFSSDTYKKAIRCPGLVLFTSASPKCPWLGFCS